MDLAALGTSIKARAVADTGSGGLFNSGTPLVTGIYNTNAPDDATFPYLVYSVAAMGPNDTFTGEVDEIMFRITVYDMRHPDGATPRDPILRCSNIIARVIGPGGTSPSYGFHRHTLSITSSDGWASGTIVRGSQAQNHTDDVYQFDLDFRVLLTR